MISSVDSAFHVLTGAYSRGERLLLLFDYDGTLTHFAPHPLLAKIPQERLNTLRELAFKPRISLGFVSGRRLDDLRSLVDVEPAYYAGNSGVEIDLRGVQIAQPRSAEILATAREIWNTLRPIPKEFPGVWLEDKKYSVTLHYREAESSSHSEIVRRTQKAFADNPNVRLEEGPLAIEAYSALGRCKGDAVRVILSDFGPAAPLTLYAGDSENDLPAMREVAKAGGIAVSVGDAPLPHSSCHVSSPDEIWRLLQKLNEHVESVAPSRRVDSKTAIVVNETLAPRFGRTGAF